MPRGPTGCDGDAPRELKSVIKYLARCSCWGSSSAEPAWQSPDQGRGRVPATTEARKSDFRGKGALARGFAGQMLAATALCRREGFLFWFLTFAIFL